MTGEYTNQFYTLLLTLPSKTNLRELLCFGILCSAKILFWEESQKAPMTDWNVAPDGTAGRAKSL